MTTSEELPGVAELSRLVCDDRSAFDCFNEDLVWILDKLVDRTGGVAGAICGHLAGGERPTLLAVSSNCANDPQLTLQLTLRAAAAPLVTGLPHDSLQIAHSLLNLRDARGGMRRYRILQLAFSPAERVKIVASVAKDSRRGFNFLEEAAARRLYPVLSRYVRLWWVHRAERRKAQILSAVIDRSDLAIMLLNREARLLFANSRARALLNTRDGLQRQQAAVTATRDGDQTRLQATIEQALHMNQDVGAVHDASPILQMGRRPGQRELIVTVAAVYPPAVDADDPAAIIYALDPDHDLEQLLAPVCGIYKLTTAEARLVHHLVNGRRLVDAAQLMQIRPQTARAYLKQVFTKTRTHRQADLVRVMLTSTLPTNTPADATSPHDRSTTRSVG